jgi:carbon monoxide dehydrogenase subunit G
MRLTDEVTVDAPPEEVFAFVSDLTRSGACLPGARVEASDGGDHRAAMRVKVGPIVADYVGTLRFVARDPGARRAVLHARADETAGRGQAEARIETTIDDVGGASRIRIDTDLQIRGRVAQFGRGAIEHVAQRLLAEFGRNLERALAGAPEPAAPASRPPRAAREEAAPPAAAELDVLDLFAGEAGTRLLRALVPALLGLGYGYLLGRLRERKTRTAGR